MQVTDLAGQIWFINQLITQSAAFGNHTAVSELVENLETLLTPYFDKKYLQEIQEIDSIKVEGGRNQIERRNNLAIYNLKKIKLVHRALQKLAYRNGFYPAARKNNTEFVIDGCVE